MRVALYFTYFCILLLSGGNNLHATTNDSHIGYTIKTTLAKNHQVKFFHKDQDSDLIEDADTDVEDDFHIGTDNKDNCAKKLAVNNYFLPKVWYQDISGLTLVDFNYNILKVIPQFSGYSSPIFTRLRVLRI